MQTAPPLPPKTRARNSNQSHVVTIRIRDEPPSYYCCGRCSPSDTFDSGTCSDLDAAPLPPTSIETEGKAQQTGISVTVIHGSSPPRSDYGDSNISCDSLSSEQSSSPPNGLPYGLLQDIRLSANSRRPSERSTHTYEADRYYTFHLNESCAGDEDVRNANSSETAREEAEECFAGLKALVCDPADEETARDATIRSARGTVRGVKNRVRAGIATFLMASSGAGQANGRLDLSRDAGRIVLYSTSMGIIRTTYQKCSMVRQILRTLLVKYEERDLFMASHHREQLQNRLGTLDVELPQLFVDGRYIGGADAVEQLNESGELRRLLRPYRCSPEALTPCRICGGYRLLPCPVCNGSKKSVHRNHFTAEFVALKCMNCDEVGLVQCDSC